MNKLNSDKKCYYFKIIEMFSLIKRKINEKLADAIRAGNEISLGQNENFFYINVFCFEDVAYKIMEQIKNIIIDTNWESTDFISNNKVYKNEVFDDIFNYDKDDIDYISKYYFYCKLKNSLYNLYEFFPEEFEKNNYEKCIEKIDSKELKNLICFIINGYIYGYYTKEKAQKISDLFETNYNINNLKTLLYNVNNNEILNETPEEFVNWVKKIKILNNSDYTTIDVKTYNKSDYEYNCDNYGISYIKFNESELDISLFESILEKVDTDPRILGINMFKYGDIFFELLLLDEKIYDIPNNDILNETWILTLKNLYKYNKYVDNIGNKYYYVRKNFISTLFVEKTSLQQRAIDEFKGFLYEGTLLDPVKLLDDYNKKYKGKSFNKNELNNKIKYYSDILKRVRFDVHTTDK